MTRPTVTLIYARALNDVIGDGNNLPAWKIVGDLPRFKELTKDSTVVMGRKTWESLPKKLPGRQHAYISKNNLSWLAKADGAGPDWTFTSPEGIFGTAFEMPQFAPNGKIFIIGGAQIYERLQWFVDFIEETVVMSNMVEGDVRWKHTVPCDLIHESRTTGTYRTRDSDDTHPVEAIFRTHKVRT